MTTEKLKEKIENILPFLNERQKRIFLGGEAKYIGYGGISKIAKLAGVSRPTIHKGITDLESVDKAAIERVRLSGGGPKSKHSQNIKLQRLIRGVKSL